MHAAPLEARTGQKAQAQSTRSAPSPKSASTTAAKGLAGVFGADGFGANASALASTLAQAKVAAGVGRSSLQATSTKATQEVEARNRLTKEKLTDVEVDKLYDIVQVTAGILEQHGIRYTAEGGTLLGAIRNGGLIKHDNDADFDVLQSDLEKIKALAPQFARYGLEVIVTPGWGLQIAHVDSEGLDPGLWTDGEESWTSKWPFLDLIAIQWEPDGAGGKYTLAQDVARDDYPSYYLSQSDWEGAFEKVPFGHLQLNAIGGEGARKAYLDRNYKDWDTKIEMVMDHRANEYFAKPIQCDIKPEDAGHRQRSAAPSTLLKPWQG